MTLPWLRVISPNCQPRLRQIGHVLFDFDGTLSVLREGWERVMAPLMVETICGKHAPIPEIDAEVLAYIDRSTGILTIEQMRWLSEAVARYGLNPMRMSPGEYKTLYLERLMWSVQQRIDAVEHERVNPDDMLLAGSRSFLTGLKNAGPMLYLASGSDHTGVLNEAGVLKIACYFDGGIYGALDNSDINDKGRIIRRILVEHHLGGESLLVIGDGPVELRQAKSVGALAMGVASDEVARMGWNERKITRLNAAGADVIIPDFIQTDVLLDFLKLG